MDIEYGKEVIRCDSAYAVLDGLCRVPKRPTSAPMRMAIFGVFNFKGVDIALAGRVEQGIVELGEEFVPPFPHQIHPCARRWKCISSAWTSPIQGMSA